MGASPGLRRVAAPVVAAAAVGAAGCGGAERQDADEPSGAFRVQVVEAAFPAAQRIAAPETLVIAVRNPGPRELPDLAVTVTGFSARSDDQELADAQQPVWIVDRGPRGASTAYADTWAGGPLAAGATRRMAWRVTAVQPGTHQLRWAVAAGLAGRARAVMGGNRAPEGQFVVRVSAAPPQARVGAGGKVVAE